MADLSIQGLSDDMYEDFKVVCIRKGQSIKERVTKLLAEDVRRNT